MSRRTGAITLLSLLLALIAASAAASDEAVIGVETTGETKPPTDVLTLEEAAQLLRVGPESLEASAQQGEVPGRKIGPSWRFSRPRLMRWLAGVGEPPVPADELVVEELVALRARGPEEAAAETEKESSEEVHTGNKNADEAGSE